MKNKFITPMFEYYAILHNRSGPHDIFEIVESDSKIDIIQKIEDIILYHPYIYILYTNVKN